MMKKRIILISSLFLILAAVGILWCRWAAPTRIALVDFQPFQAASIVKANSDRFVRYDIVPNDELHKLKRSDFVLGFGMGMRITAKQRAQIQRAADRGVPVYIHTATNPENAICNLDSLTLRSVQGYLNSGNKRNYRNMARYVRRAIDSKKWFAPLAEAAVETASDVLYHLNENVWFDNVEAYERYLMERRFYIEGGARVAIVGGLNDPFSGNRENIDSLIVSFQRAGMNVYPVASAMQRLRFLKDIAPDAVIYFPHGRVAMGQADAAVEWLVERNIPIFAPLSILQTRGAWEDDPQGMFGGFLSQSVVMPELDGAIYPYVVNAQEIDEDGVYLFKAIPERLAKFTKIVGNFVALRHKPNAEKRVAVCYLGGASGLELVPSLHNLLLRLRAEGYHIDGLPSTASELAAAMKSQPRLVLGNVALMQQPRAGTGDDDFAILHGTKQDPPQEYTDAYMWVQNDFRADALLHFGTHGSLEFTPSKQVALSDNDWPDRLIGTVPHFYYYTIGNVGEGVIAKRRTYATLVSYLTPPFMESGMRGEFMELQERIQAYYKDETPEASLAVKKAAVGMGLHRELRLDSIPTEPYSAEQIARIENFAEEIATEKMTGRLYTTGIPYEREMVHSSVVAMSADPIAYSLAALDRLRGRADGKLVANKVWFSGHYLDPAKSAVARILDGQRVDSAYICRLADITPHELTEARKILAPPVGRAMAAAAAGGNSGGNSGGGRKSGGGHPAWIPKIGTRPESTKKTEEKHPTPTPDEPYTREQKERARAIVEIERTVRNVDNYRAALQDSPELELRSLLNALSGGYVAPSPGGDAVASPNAVPTGRNLYAVNAEATPSEAAWEKGVELAEATLEAYKKQHGEYPRKVSYTFWSSEFIETEGATIAQTLRMLGVEPVRDAFGRVSDLRLTPAETLGRPRVDVVVQTSGQFRDLAASRLSLVSRAVEMAAAADESDNYVRASTTETERLLVEQGVPPKDAREMATARVFGGVNGMYGTGIQRMVTAGDRWENESEIAAVYLNNMGAVYGSDKTWGDFHEGLLRAVLHNTDVVVQPRQSNTWGALSLDHVYEFMGGMNLAVREVTGKDPDAYFADYRNRNRVRMQELKEAIGVESRATLFNPEYIREVMKGGASSAAQIVDYATNTYGWNVMKPDVIDDELWDRFHEVYIEDGYGLGTEAFFRRENPQALQEVTAVMLETARKGMWQATERQLADLAALHTDLVREFGASDDGFAGSNARLQEFIAQKVDPGAAEQYRRRLRDARQSVASQNGVVMKKEEMAGGPDGEKNKLNGLSIAAVAVAVFVLLLLRLRKRRKK